jgi:UDP-GlcNAc3NAcA epimerase
MYISVVGARPQFVKLAPVVEEFNKRGMKHEVIHTGQHYDYEMSQAFFDDLEIPEPDYYLGVGSGTHAYQTAEALKGVEEILVKKRPEMVITYGDTNSTLAGTLAASKLKIDSAHVEAGLRSFDKGMPEEINRVLTDHASEILFAPTETAVRQLEKEGIPGRRIFLVGDIMVEVLEKSKRRASKSRLRDKLRPDKFYLATVHRPVNTDAKENLVSILDAFQRLDMKVVLPSHPRTRKAMKSYKIWKENQNRNIIFTEPLKHTEFVGLMLHCRAVLTDSGGIQKESFLCQKPCITLRETTEWVETLEMKSNVLVGVDEERIAKAVETIKDRNVNWSLKPYGNGDTSKKILDVLEGKKP